MGKRYTHVVRLYQVYCNVRTLFLAKRARTRVAHPLCFPCPRCLLFALPDWSAVKRRGLFAAEIFGLFVSGALFFRQIMQKKNKKVEEKQEGLLLSPMPHHVLLAFFSRTAIRSQVQAIFWMLNLPMTLFYLNFKG
jgi:hypothetical protein